MFGAFAAVSPLGLGTVTVEGSACRMQWAYAWRALSMMEAQRIVLMCRCSLRACGARGVDVDGTMCPQFAVV